MPDSLNIQVAAELVADAIIRRLYPCRDDISTREARTAYGRQWLEHQVNAGRVKGHRVGNRTVFSRLELDALRAEEMQTAAIIVKTLNTL